MQSAQGKGRGRLQQGLLHDGRRGSGLRHHQQEDTHQDMSHHQASHVHSIGSLHCAVGRGMED